MIGMFTRYILWEILKLFMISLMAITILIMMVLVVERAIAFGLGLSEVLQLLPYLTLVSLEYALPATLLFAVCSVYGRMAADNEVIAVKSSGVSPMAIVVPVFSLGLLLSPVAVIINDLAISWGRSGVNRVVMHSLEEIAYRTLRRDLVFSPNNRFSIKIKAVEDRWLISPIIAMFTDGPDPLTIAAKRARLSLNPDKEVLVIELENYQVSVGEKEMSSGLTRQVELPFTVAARKNQDNDRPSQYSLLRIDDEVEKDLTKIAKSQDQWRLYQAGGMALGRLDVFRDNHSYKLQRGIEVSQDRLTRLRIEPWRRWAIGFSCFFFVWLGVPLAIWMKSADYWTTFGLCFLPILAIYFPLFGLGLDRSKDGEWPAYSVWMGNFAIFCVGGWLLRKIYRS